MIVAILAGGTGSRLASVVRNRPKAMAMIGSRPFLELLLLWLRGFEYREVVLCVGNLWTMIRDHFADGARLGIRIAYSIESEPLGTAGALRHAACYLDSTFLAMNGDSFFDCDLTQLVGLHAKKSSAATLALAQMDDQSPYGAVTLDQDGKVVHFVEKWNLTSDPWTSAGIYVFEPSVLKLAPAGRPVSLEQELLPKMIQLELPVFGYQAPGRFLDIGTPERYAFAQQALAGRAW